MPLSRHGVENEKTESLMRKQKYKEQKQPRRYYFFDYLFWLGEMARWHYKGEPNRPDGNAMLMLCIMIVVFEPMLVTVFCFDPPIRDFIAIGMAVVSGVGVVNSLDRIYDASSVPPGVTFSYSFWSFCLSHRCAYGEQC